MAKSWSGFGPQNDVVKANWEVMEAGPSDIAKLLEAFGKEQPDESANPEEDAVPSVEVQRSK